jgi:hypothetical protein
MPALAIGAAVKLYPDSTIPVGSRTLPPEFTLAPRTGRQALLERYGRDAERLYKEFLERGAAAEEHGYHGFAFELFACAALWRQVADDQHLGAELVLVDEGFRY